MSLGRLALRLAAVEALCPYAVAASGPYPTLAGRNIFDSRVDQIEEADQWESFLTAIDGQPLVIVYADDHESEPKEGSDYPAAQEFVDLVVELMIAAKATIEVETPAGMVTQGTLAAPVTDRQREALLDFLEGQIRNAFDLRSIANSSGLFRQVAWECRHIRSVPQREATGIARVAARSCHFKVKVASDQWPQLPVSPAPVGLAALPAPLSIVANGLDPASSGGQLCAALAALVAAPAAQPALTGVFVGPQWTRTWPPGFTPPSAAEVAGETAPADMTADAVIPQE